MAIDKLTRNLQNRSKGFDCGRPFLNDYIRMYSLANQKHGFSHTYVENVPDDDGKPRVRGYVSLCASAVEKEHVPEAANGPGSYPTILIGSLAVNKADQGNGLGEMLLFFAIKKIIDVADVVGVSAVEIMAIDEVARDFYIKYGFVHYLDDSCHLHLPLGEARRMGLVKSGEEDE